MPGPGIGGDPAIEEVSILMAVVLIPGARAARDLEMDKLMRWVIALGRDLAQWRERERIETGRHLRERSTAAADRVLIADLRERTDDLLARLGRANAALAAAGLPTVLLPAPDAGALAALAARLGTTEVLPGGELRRKINGVFAPGNGGM